MANTRHPTSGHIGSFTAVPQDAATAERPDDMKEGTIQYGADNTQWALGRVSGSVSAGVCTFNASTFAITSAAGNHTAPVNLTDGQLAWVYLTAGASA